jgi:hypothetical protein
LGHVVVGEGSELVEDGWDVGPVGDGGGDGDEICGVEATVHAEGEPLMVGWRWGGGNVAGEVEGAGARLVGNPFFDVGDGFADVLSEAGVVVAAFGEESEGLEVFVALGEVIFLSAGVVAVLGGVVGGKALVESVLGVFEVFEGGSVEAVFCHGIGG